MNDRLLADVAALGLPRRNGATAPSHVLHSATLDDVLRGLVRHRMVGTFAEAVRVGAVELAPESFARVADEHESWARHVLHVERALLAVTGELRSAGIPYRLFKGAALAHTVYPDPSERLYVDVDLLVPAERLAQAELLVAQLTGGARVMPELSEGHEQEFGKGVTIRSGHPEIDIHRTFVTGPIGLTIPLDELFADGDRFELAGHTVDVLAPLHQLVQVCINAAVGDRPIRLQSLRDVALVAQAIDPDPGELEWLAHRWRCLAVVQHAVTETWTTLRLEPTALSEWAASVQPTRTERLLLSAYLSDARSYSRPLASVLVIPGALPRLRYLRSLVWPDRAYLEARGWSRTAHVKRALGRLRRWRP